MTDRYVDTASTAGGDGTTEALTGSTRAFATLLEAVNSLPSTLTDAYTIYCKGAAADTSVKPAAERRQRPTRLHRAAGRD